MRAFLLVSVFVHCFGVCVYSQSDIPLLDFNIDRRVDSVIKVALVEQIKKNPAMAVAESRQRSAVFDKREANSNWLSVFRANMNINEFVITNSPNAAFYPLYNFGIGFNFDIFSRITNSKKRALEAMKVTAYEKESLEKNLTRQVLLLYEQFKEKKDLLDFQKRLAKDRFDSYTGLQKQFAAGQLTDIAVVNREYTAYIQQQIVVRESTTDYLSTIILLEELLGVPLEKYLIASLSSK